MEAGLADRLALKEACRAWRYVCWGVPVGLTWPMSPLTARDFEEPVARLCELGVDRERIVRANGVAMIARGKHG